MLYVLLFVIIKFICIVLIYLKQVKVKKIMSEAINSPTSEVGACEALVRADSPRYAAIDLLV